MRRTGYGGGASIRMLLLLAAFATGSAGFVAADLVSGRAPLQRRPTIARALPGGTSALPAGTSALPRVPAVPAAAVPSQPKPSFHARVLTVDAQIRARMGTSWRPGCPVPLEDLRVIEMTFWDFAGRVQTGELMVHRTHAADIAGVFRKIFEAHFPIERMVLANGYMGNDPPLAQFNNTAGFNCRRSVGSKGWSEHAYGRAVDINPDQNPYVSPSGRVEPPFGRRWVDRMLSDPGMIRRGDVVVEAFRAIGWHWGGAYRRSKDWMHFSVTGR